MSGIHNSGGGRRRCAIRSLAVAGLDADLAVGVACIFTIR